MSGRGHDVGIPRGRSRLTCPVDALVAWRERVQHQFGDAYTDDLPILLSVNKAGRILPTGISPEGLTAVLKKRAEAARLDGRWGGRSLRAGFITTCADNDVPAERTAIQSRHKSLDSLLRYVRTDDVFRNNAADRVGL